MTLFRKNIMKVYVAYNEYQRDDRDFIIKYLKRDFDSKFGFCYRVEFIDAKKNEVNIIQMRPKSNPAKLRLNRRRANNMLRRNEKSLGS